MSEVKSLGKKRKLKGDCTSPHKSIKGFGQEEPACEMVTILTIEAESHTTQSKKGKIHHKL